MEARRVCPSPGHPLQLLAELSDVQRDGDAETGAEHDEGASATRELDLQGGNKSPLEGKSCEVRNEHGLPPNFFGRCFVASPSCRLSRVPGFSSQQIYFGSGFRVSNSYLHDRSGS